jgi:hypothetical protein
VCEASAVQDLDRLGYIPPEKIIYNIDITDIKPIKVQLGDIDGDGIKEVAICVYKTAKFHPVMAKRPFFYKHIAGNLVPVWLGSRLSRPFDDYILADIDADGIDEVISIERLENGESIIAMYNWKGFGFEVDAESEEFDGDVYFDYDKDKETEAEAEAETAEINIIFYNRKEYVRLRLFLQDNNLIYTYN